MSFSGRQQGIFRPMVAGAWVWHCRAEGLGAEAAAMGKKHPAYRAWYERELEEATGCASSSDCNAWRDFNFAMAHFEVLARDGIYWQMELAKCDAKRILWNIARLVKRHGLEEDYLRGVARNARRKRRREAGLDEEELPALIDLSTEELSHVLMSVKSHVRQKAARTARTTSQADNCPF